MSASNPTVTNVTFSGNSAGTGGGMANSSSSPMVTNVTFSGNSAYQGGGMYNFNNSSPTLTNVTFNGGDTGTGRAIYNDSSSVTLRNTIFVTSTGDNCYNAYGTITDGGGNLSSDATCGVAQNATIKLGTLADNGGLTQTIPLLTGSAAIDNAGSNCPAADQRGQPRSTPCDSGAYEVQTAPFVVTNPASGVLTTSATLHGVVNANNTSVAAISFQYGLTTSYGSTIAATPGAASGPADTHVTAALASLTPNTTYHFRVVADSAVGTDATFTTLPPFNATLSNLVVSSGTLTPAFVSDTFAYAADVASGVTSLTVTPTATDSKATITVNGAAVASGSASAAIPINLGMNTISIVVTGRDGVTTQTYTVTVGRGNISADPAGLCGGHTPCYTSLQAAINVAGAGGAVTVFGGTYHESATLNKNADVTLFGNVTLTGSLTLVVGAFHLGSHTFTLSGNLTNMATFDPGTGIVVMAGSGLQTISGGGTLLFNDLTIANTSGLNPAVKLKVNAVVSGTLTVQTSVLQVYVDTFILIGPVVFGLTNSSVAENQPVGTTVGTCTLINPLWTYALVSGDGGIDNGSFTLTGSTLTTAAIFDYETKSSYNIRLRMTDQWGEAYEQTFTIMVTDVVESSGNSYLLWTK